MERITVPDNVCDRCLHSRAVISENGFHYVCCLTKKQCLDCLMGVKNSFEGLKGE